MGWRVGLGVAFSLPTDTSLTIGAFALTEPLYDAQQLLAALEEGGFDPSRISIESRSVTSGVQGLFALAYAD